MLLNPKIIRIPNQVIRIHKMIIQIQILKKREIVINGRSKNYNSYIIAILKIKQIGKRLEMMLDLLQQ
jgi:hypothetical protein